MEKAFRKTAVTAIEPDPTPPSSEPRGSYVKIGLVVPAPGPGAFVESEWQADIATGAVAELVNNGAPGILCNGLMGSILSATTVNGQTATAFAYPSILTNAPANQYFSATKLTHAEITRGVTRTAQQAGVSVDSLTIIDADGPALELVVSVGSPAQLTQALFLRLTSMLMPHPSPFVGMYLEIRSKSGTALAKITRSARTSSGGQWEAAGIDVGFAHG